MEKRKNKFQNIEEEIASLTRRLNKITMDLYTCDSDCALRKIPDIENRLEVAFRHIITNENEFRIFRDIVASLQRDFYRKRTTSDPCRQSRKKQA